MDSIIYLVGLVVVIMLVLSFLGLRLSKENLVMTHVGPAPVVTSSRSLPSLVEWGPVLAGAALAAALSFVLLTFGTAIGLTATSPWPGSGLSAKVIASLAIFWAMAQQIGTFMVGGYVAGRLRSSWTGSSDEVEFRDGLHGGLVWAVGVVVGAALLMATAGAATRAGGEIAGKAITSASATSDPTDLVLDTMLRPTTVAQAGAAPAPATPPAAGAAATGPRARAATAANTTDEQRAEISRVLAASVAKGSLSPPDRTYLAQLVAQRTGLSQQEAERRVDEAVTAAREAADKARRAAVLTGFVTAAALIISLAAAWWAGLKGGQHRGNSVPARFDFANRRRVPT